MLSVDADPNIKDRFDNDAYSIADSVEKTPDSKKVHVILQQHKNNVHGKKKVKNPTSSPSSNPANLNPNYGSMESV